MSSNTPKPGDTIKITGSFDLNIDLPEDIKIFVKTFETIPDSMEGFEIMGVDPVPVNMTRDTTLELEARFDSNPEDVVVSWELVGNPATAEIVASGTQSVTIDLFDDPGAPLEQIEVVATASSATLGQTSTDSVTIAKTNSIGTINNLTLTSDQGTTIPNGGFTQLSVTNGGTANEVLLDYIWTCSDPNATIGGQEIPPGSGQYFSAGPTNVIQFGTDDTEVQVNVVASSDQSFDAFAEASIEFTIGNGSAPIPTIGNVSISTTPGDIPNFATRTFTATYDGNVPTAFYTWGVPTDKQAIIVPSGNSADITFQTPDTEHQVTCTVANDLAADSPGDAFLNVTVGNPGGYVPVEGEEVEPGSGWTSLLTPPPALGNPNDVAHDMMPVARWTTKQFMGHVDGEGLINHYIIADHHNGIAYVDFSLDNGTFVRVTETTYVPAYDADLYVISVDPNKLPLKDSYEIRAIVVPSSGQPRVLQSKPDGIIPDTPDENGEMQWSPAIRGMFGMIFSKIDPSRRKLVYVDNVNGEDSTDPSVADGSEAKPYQSPSYAIYHGLGNGINYADSSFCTVELINSGEPYKIPPTLWPLSSANALIGWIHIKSQDPSNPCTIKNYANDSSGSLSQNLEMVRYSDIIFDYIDLQKDKSILGGKQGSHLLVENCSFVSELGRGQPFGGQEGWSGFFDCLATNMEYGPYKKGLAVNCHINGLIHDAYRSSCMFNCSLEFAGKFVPGYYEAAHMDVYQIYYEGGIVDNIVIHGLTATERVATQGIYFSGNSVEFRNFLVKNTKIDIRDSINGVPNPNGVDGVRYNWYVYTDTRHFLVRDCEFTNGYHTRAATEPAPDYGDQIPGVTINEDDENLNPFFSAEGTIFENVTFNNSIEPMLPYPDRLGGNGKGDFYFKDGSPPFPWTSPSTLITYKSDVFTDYLLEVRVTENDLSLPDSNEITPGSRTLKAVPLTDQSTITYQWTVTSSDGDLSFVTNTSGTDQEFVLQVSEGNNDRLYTVTVDAYSPDLDETVTKSLTYLVRKPLEYPVTFSGELVDVGGNYYRLFRDSLKPGDTWLDNDGADVMPLSWTQLEARSFRNGLTFYFSSEEELIATFLGEYTGKNMSFTFKDKPVATLNAPIQLDVNCAIGTSSTGEPYLRFESDQWTDFPGTASVGNVPFSVVFTD